MKWLARATFFIMAVTVIFTIIAMIGRYGMIPGLDFGCGQYYYTDIPDWPRYFSIRGIVETCPQWLSYGLFAVWGVLMYKLWLWIDRRSVTAAKPVDRPDAGSTVRAFPLFLVPRGARVLVIGRGRIATHKAETLREYGFDVEACERDRFDESAVGNYALVVASTRDSKFNRRVSAVCREANVLVNVVDDPEFCTCYFAAVERKGPFTVAVSSNGTCPVATQILRDRIRPLLTDELVATTERLGRERAEWKKAHPEPAERAAAMKKEFESC